MSIELWLAFAAAAAVVLIIPGPTILTVISYSVSDVYDRVSDFSVACTAISKNPITL
jgi:threonine/homoserine/homoserine lactone efflux protein